MAPGAQNGFKNSGNQMTVKGPPDIHAISPWLSRMATAHGHHVHAREMSQPKGELKP